MAQNFTENIQLFQPLKRDGLVHKKAALIASGPSLNNTVEWLKVHEQEFDIYCVGSALNVLLRHDIHPKKIFMIDAQETMLKQIHTTYCGELVFLSTANAEAEQFAKKMNQPLFSTGGSIATTAFSFIEWLGYEELYLFGQDLGFIGTRTHVEGSTSGKEITQNHQIFDVLANDGSMIQTTPNLIAYKRWFDQAFFKSEMKLFNTAEKGAKLENTTFFDITLKS